MNLYGESLQNVPFIEPREREKMFPGRLRDHVNEKQTPKKVKFLPNEDENFLS